MPLRSLQSASFLGSCNHPHGVVAFGNTRLTVPQRFFEGQDSQFGGEEEPLAPTPLTRLLVGPVVETEEATLTCCDAVGIIPPPMREGVCPRRVWRVN